MSSISLVRACVRAYVGRKGSIIDLFVGMLTPYHCFYANWMPIIAQSVESVAVSSLSLVRLLTHAVVQRFGVVK